MTIQEKDETMMSNKQLSLLCSKGLCEWRDNNSNTVKHFYDYEIDTENDLVSENIMIRPLDKILGSKQDVTNTWFIPSISNYEIIYNNAGMRNFCGGFI